MAAEVFVELKAIITEFQAKMAEARGEMAETARHGGKSFESLGKFAGAALAGIGTGAIAGVALAVKAGNELEDANVKLEQAIKNTGGSYEALKPSIDKADKSMESFGFTNAQTQDALAVGTTATGSSTKALQLLTVAANLAAYKHTDLATAMVAVAKGSEGNLRPLKQLGIDLPVVAGGAQKLISAEDSLHKAQDGVIAVLQKYPDALNKASKGHAAYEAAVQKVKDAQLKLSAVQQAGGTIIADLSKRLAGQASAAAGTFSGKIEVAKVKLEDMAAKLGLKLIPIIEKFIGWLSTGITWLEKHKRAAELLAAVFAGVLATAIAVFTANKLIALVNGIRGVIGWFQKLGTTATTSGAEVEASSSGMAGKFGGALAVMGAGIIAFQGTMALLKSNFLGIGSAVNGAAKAISDFFGGVGQVKPTTSLTAQTVAFLEAIASGKQTASNISPTQAVADLHQAGVPGFAFGGLVPGPIGSPMLAVVHGGERVVPAGGGGGDLVIQVGGQEFMRIFGPQLRTWMERGPARNAVRGRLTS